jgi:hypothetical protein
MDSYVAFATCDLQIQRTTVAAATTHVLLSCTLARAPGDCGCQRKEKKKKETEKEREKNK